jgi:LmbE family N-acetylglucosaminyl deacetylase
VDHLVNQFRPVELYIPAPTMHQDHVVLYEAGVRAARSSARGDKSVPRKTFLEYAEQYALPKEVR